LSNRVAEFAREFVIAGRRIEVVTIAGPGDKAPIVMLHEGLGSVALWRDFPQQLAHRTRRSVIVYSRYGHGHSDRLTEPRTPRYMHDEGEVVLPALLDELGLERPVLFGHSDGASIALIHASQKPEDVSTLILEAPHVFVEDLTVSSIARVRDTLHQTSLVQKLSRYHNDAAATFWGWNNIWLHPDFRGWDIRASLRRVRAPALLLQGLDDEYGTVAQLDAISSTLASTETHLFDRCGHSPHGTVPEAVLERTADFLANRG
jgi:pimeloyl-ACP methyl ester carboxylesterase